MRLSLSLTNKQKPAIKKLLKFRHSTTKILVSRRLRQNVLEFKANLGHIPRLYLKRKQRRKKRKTKKQKGARNKLETQTIIFPVSSQRQSGNW